MLVLQQQLLAEAQLLQLLAQLVQFTGQLLALQLLQHQVLQCQGHVSVDGVMATDSWWSSYLVPPGCPRGTVHSASR